MASAKWYYEKIDLYRGFKYFVALNTEEGYRCGYVEIDEDYPLYDVHYSEIDCIESVDLTFSGNVKEFGGYYIGWGHDVSNEGVDLNAIAKHHPEDANKYIDRVRGFKDVSAKFATLDDVEKECFEVINELIRRYGQY